MKWQMDNAIDVAMEDHRVIAPKVIEFDQEIKVF